MQQGGAKAQNVITLTASDSETTESGEINTEFTINKSFSELLDMVNSTESEVLFELYFPQSEDGSTQKHYAKVTGRSISTTPATEYDPECTYVFMSSINERFSGVSGLLTSKVRVTALKYNEIEFIQAVEYAYPSEDIN